MVRCNAADSFLNGGCIIHKLDTGRSSFESGLNPNLCATMRVRQHTDLRALDTLCSREN